MTYTVRWSYSLLDCSQSLLNYELFDFAIFALSVPNKVIHSKNASCALN